LARKSALLLAEERERAGNLAGAIEAARRASEIDPDDEAAARRWIALLDRSGDRAQAFAVYEKFRKHVAEEFGSRPSAETIALVDAVRTRREANLPAVTAQTHDDLVPVPANVAVKGPPPPPAPLARTVQQTRSHSQWLWAVAAVALLAIVVAWTATRGKKEASASNVSRSLVVLPAENETGDEKLDYIGSGIAEGVAMRLEGIGGLKIRSGARSEWPAATRHDYKTIANEFGPTVLLRTTVGKVGDSLEVRASVVDAKTSGERSVAARRFSTSQLRDVESGLAADIAGAVFRVPLPAIPRAPTRPIDPESYRLTLEGWHAVLTQRDRTAGKDLFQRAVEIDPLNARAWSGLSSAWAVMALSQIPFEVGYDRSSAAAARALALDSLQSSAWANLAAMRALKYRSLAVGLELVQKAIASEPGNAEIFLVKSTLYRNAHQWDNALDAIRVAHALDPLAPSYAEREAFTCLCADRNAEALRLYNSLIEAFPNYKNIQLGLVRALARLGRYDEAIATWRKFVDAKKNPELSEALASAHGEAGYWNAKHVEGRPALEALLKAREHSYVSAQQLMQAQFLAGDIEDGFKTLEGMVQNKEQRLYHSPCAPGLDEVRNTPRLKSVFATVGPLPP
jgi:tetratricopeptide (TPR) repeat protein